jgi:uncharacterized protein (TIGR03067 family)
MLFSSGLLLSQAGDAKSDLEQLQGTWIIASLVERGKAPPAAEIANLVVTIEKDVYTAKDKGEVVAQYRIKLDPSKKPAEIDFTHLIGDHKDKTEPGIYLIEKGQVKMCLDEDKKGRPKVFEGKESESCSVIVLKKRDKEPEKIKEPEKKKDGDKK